MSLMKAFLLILFTICSTCFAFPTKVLISKPAIILSHILKNRPSLDRKEAKNLAAIIYEVSIIHHIDPFLYTAMLMQESKYIVSAVSYKIVFNKKTGKLEKIPQDFGIAQINFKTIEAFKFDKKRLLTDLEYSIEAGAIVLKDFSHRFHFEEKWWSRYNAQTLEKREIYQSLVSRYM